MLYKSSYASLGAGNNLKKKCVKARMKQMPMNCMANYAVNRGNSDFIIQTFPRYKSPTLRGAQVHCLILVLNMNSLQSCNYITIFFRNNMWALHYNIPSLREQYIRCAGILKYVLHQFTSRQHLQKARCVVSGNASLMSSQVSQHGVIGSVAIIHVEPVSQNVPHGGAPTVPGIKETTDSALLFLS